MTVRTYTDMLGREVTINYPPKRIVSLVPSQTELLHDLGLEDEVVGITKFCVHPESWFRSKARIGGTKQVHIDKVRDLQPDLIIANKEENVQEQIQALESICPVWVSNIQTLDESLQMIYDIGDITGTQQRAANIATQISNGFHTLSKATQPKKVAYFIWRNPWMCAGGDTFINDIITRMGWCNVFSDRMRYPELTLNELTAAQPEIVLLSSEPYPFKDKHIAEIQQTVPQAQVLLVDGEMFSWYGSRLVHAVPYLSAMAGSI